MNAFYYISRAFLKGFFRIFYGHKVIFIEDYLFPKSAIIAANHISFLDPPLIAASWPEAIHFFARSTLFKNPFFKRLIESLNAHPVGRGQDLQSMKTACKLLEDGKKIVLFPEGTRSEDGIVAPFKRGIGLLALKTHAPIIPVYISGAKDAWPRGRKMPHLFGKKTACIIGKPIFPEALGLTTPEAVAQHVREEIIKLSRQFM